MPKLLEGTVAKISVPPGKREVLVFDDQLPGFGVRKFKSGKASYFVKFNVGRQQRKHTLGAVVPGVLAEMRREASRILAKARLGIDVTAERKAAANKSGVTLGKLVPKYLNGRQIELRAKTFAEFSRYLQGYWSPLHHCPVDAIRRGDIVGLVDTIAAAHGKVAADRARTALSTFFAWAIEREYLELNPVQNIKRRAKNVAGTRVLSESELVRMWKACGTDDYGFIVRLLILTGQRREEIGGLELTEINQVKRLIELPPQRTKNGRPHVIPLSEEALAILSAVPWIDGRAHLFGSGSRGFQGWSKAKTRLDKQLDGSLPGHSTISGARS